MKEIPFTPPEKPIVSVLGGRVVIRVGAGIACITPDDSADVRQAMFIAEGEARGNVTARAGGRN